MKKYLIITTQRAGSTWLVDMINSNSRVASYSELLILTPGGEFPTYGNSDFRLYDKWKTIKGFNKRFNLFRRPKAIYKEYFDELLQLNQQKEGIEAFGLKVMYQQVAAYRGFLDFALGYFDTIIHLKRRNHLDVAVSKAYMEQYQITHNPMGERPTIELNLKETINYIKKLVIAERKFTKILQKQVEGKVNTCFYEDLVADNDHEMNKVFHHIGVPSALVETTFEKGNKNSLLDIVSNYDELVIALDKQGMTHYLDV
jgi:LPS sulfotransferase NodH